MAQPYCTGPVLIYVQPAGFGSPQFFGTAERFPQQQITPEWEPVYNDMSGQRLPLDILYEGEEAYVTADVTRWNERLMASMMARPSGLGTRGRNVFGDIGSIMVLEGFAFPLWLRFPYSAKAVFQNAANGPMPDGFHFLAAHLKGPDSYTGLGTGPKKIRCIWHCMRIFSPPSNFLLYDQNMAGLPAVD